MILAGAWDSGGEVQLSGNGGEVVLNKNYNLEENGLVTLSLIDKANNNETAIATFNIPEGGYILHVNDKGTAVNFFGTVKEGMDGVYAPSMTESELNTFLDSLNRNFRGSVDWIVEEDTDGIWTYRKWDSGIAECWCSTSTSSLTWTSYMNSGSTNYLYYSSGWNINLPFGLTDTSYVLNATCLTTGSNFGWVARGSKTTTSFTLYLVRNGNTGACYVDVSIKGRWK